MNGSKAGSQTAAQRTVLSRSEAETLALGGRLFAVARAGDVITLSGDLGVGKTVLARGFVRAGAAPGGLLDETFDVPSPTFTLVQVYETKTDVIWHFDLYRVEEASELWELGWEEALDEGISLIEWPDRAAGFLPEERLDVVVRQTAKKGEREIDLVAGKGWEERIGHV